MDHHEKPHSPEIDSADTDKYDEMERELKAATSRFDSIIDNPATQHTEFRHDKDSGASERVHSVGFNKILPLEGARVDDMLALDSPREIRLRRWSDPDSGKKYEINYRIDLDQDSKHPDSQHRGLVRWSFNPDETIATYMSHKIRELLKGLLEEAELASPLSGSFGEQAHRNETRAAFTLQEFDDALDAWAASREVSPPPNAVRRFGAGVVDVFRRFKK